MIRHIRSHSTLHINYSKLDVTLQLESQPDWRADASHVHIASTAVGELSNTYWSFLKLT